MPPELLALLAAAELKWSVSASVQASAGYKDNLLLSHANPEQSAFFRGGVEALVWHFPRGLTDYYAFVNAETSRYLSGKTITDDAQAFAGLEWRYRKEEAFSVVLDAQGYYLDQVFDISDTEIRRLVANLKVSGIRFGPTMRWWLLPTLWTEGAVLGTREIFQDGLNNASILDFGVSVGWTPVERLEFGLGASERQRDFDRRERYNAFGIVQEGLLSVNELEYEARAVVHWDARRRWKTTTRAGRLRYRDNGGGYLNYRQSHVRQELEWSNDTWLLRFDGEARRKEYERQTVGRGFFPPPFIKDEFAVGLRAERNLSKAWTLFAEYRWERTRSNDILASYRLNEGLLGARWNWEK